MEAIQWKCFRRLQKFDRFCRKRLMNSKVMEGPLADEMRRWSSKWQKTMMAAERMASICAVVKNEWWKCGQHFDDDEVPLRLNNAMAGDWHWAMVEEVDLRSWLPIYCPQMECSAQVACPESKESSFDLAMMAKIDENVN